MESIKKLLLDNICEAELVLIGIGEEFEQNADGMAENPEFKNYTEKIDNIEGVQWLRPYLEKIFMDKFVSDKTCKAYAALEEIVKEKNYFIISTCMDDYIFKTQLLKDRIVTPCGGYLRMQCSNGCAGELYETDKELYHRIYDSLSNGEELGLLQPPTCHKCGAKRIFNYIKAQNYVEEGYSGQWNAYMKWLQGTLNKKVCVLELGAGLRYPSVIRWPFEKVVYYNQKSSIFRVHSRLYQLTEEIKDRGYRIEENPVDFLINRFV